ncbi:hypothetical protein C2R22_05760 [Salinigranum rubrum]|uniref:Transcription regulator PadR N-terminal domain-containing protein n=2 Tax=Salinigranum rubrum TaxID=755307 RepID=A0A2I8VPR8_9EURY|nr:hypothetical protein C2R22_05760 [Salinigranum rubrum]
MRRVDGEWFHHECTPDDRAHDLEFRTDGGVTRPRPSEWPYEAVVHGADLRRDCLALTANGKPCSYQAYSGEHLCSTHQNASDPDVVAGAHQWARVTDDGRTVAVCVNCEEVWEGGAPAIAVECPICGRGVGERCRIERSGSAGANAPIPPHPERRRRGCEAVDGYTTCRAAPDVDVDDEQKQLVTDGGQVPHGQLREELTAFQRDTLYVLARDGAQYGLAIKRALEDLYGLDGTANDEVHHGRLYPNLRELEDRGLLEVGTLDKRTNEYDLSEAGQQFVRELAQTWVGATDRIDRTDQDVIDQAVRHAGGDR